MKKGNIVKMLNSCQLVKILKINNDILTVKKVGINRNTNKVDYIAIFGKYQPMGKEFEININQVSEVIQ